RSQPRALLRGGGDQAVHLVALPLVDDRAERYRARRGVAARKVRRLLGQRRHVVVIDLVGDKVTAGGHADLALVQERAPRAGRGGGRHVGVVEDDQGGVAAELQVRPLEVARGEFADATADRGRAGEADDPDERVGDQLLADVGAARQDVQQAVGQAGFLEYPGQDDAAGHARARVGLEYDGVAERERGGNRADREDLREVERGDHADDADRDPLGEAEPRLLAREQLPRRAAQARCASLACCRARVTSALVAMPMWPSSLPVAGSMTAAVPPWELIQPPEYTCPFQVSSLRNVMICPSLFPLTSHSVTTEVTLTEPPRRRHGPTRPSRGPTRPGHGR